jgi:DNA polymerase III alpha subunit (gram-positive type)
MPIQEGLRLLSEADTLVGHNIIKFDLPALRKVYPDWSSKAAIFDTLVAARVIYPDIREIDFARRLRRLAEISDELQSILPTLQHFADSRQLEIVLAMK